MEPIHVNSEREAEALYPKLAWEVVTCSQHGKDCWCRIIKTIPRIIIKGEEDVVIGGAMISKTLAELLVKDHNTIFAQNFKEEVK